MTRSNFKRFLCISIVLALAAYSLPMIALAADLDEREYDGDLKVFEKVKPEGKPDKPGKPPKPDDNDEPDLSIDKWAVVIGIADYAGVGNDLKYTDDDAKDIYNYLLSKGYPAGNMKMLLNKQATAVNIIDAINWMDSYEGTNSECVFFYSGHGSTADGYNDGDTEYTDEGIVSHDLYLILDGDLAQEFSTYSSGKIGFMFDSCFSGGMVDLAGSGRVVSAACGENEYSYDGTPRMKNGVWTYYFMQGLSAYSAIESAHNYAAPYASNFIWTSYGRIMTPTMNDQYTGNWMF